MRVAIFLMAVAVSAISAPASAQIFAPWDSWGDRGYWRDSPPPRRTYRRPPPSYWEDYEDDDYYGRRPQQPYGKPLGPALLEGGPRPAIAPKAPPVVAFPSSHPAGTVVIDTAGRKLYYVISATSAYRYPISVGRDGFTWTGTEKISRVADWPDRHPPKEMRERDASLPEKMTGGLRNPLGAKALYLGNSLYRIHGTNDSKTIGYAASSGCFRMMNHHVVHLASLAGVGTTVHVVKSVSRGGGVAANTEAR
jgi:lipoprotein-anchoring transpeptidase ErfK/SrfK